MSIPRLFWGNYINFLANWRAIKRILTEGSPHRVAWDKTTHDFPSIGEPNRARRMIGEILIAHQFINQTQLTDALTHKTLGVKIGTWLVHQGVITPDQLAQAIAEQGSVRSASFDAYEIDPQLIETIPANIALHYAVLPFSRSADKITLASESVIDPISLAALSRKLGVKIDYVIVPLGQVTVGLRHWYARHRTEDPRSLLNAAIASGKISQEKPMRYGKTTPRVNCYLLKFFCLWVV